MKKIIYVLFLLIVTCFACNKEEDDNLPDNGNGELKIMDIADAKSLFIAPSISNLKKSAEISQQDEDTTVLFKITEDGYIREVNYYDEDSTMVKMQDFPSGIWNVNSTFLIVQFSDFSGPTWAYLVNKNTEKAWLFDQICLYNCGNHHGRYITTDDNDNIYFIPSVQIGIAKVNVSNPDQPEANIILSDLPEIIVCFLTDSEGNILYNNKTIRFTNGGLYNLQNNALGLGGIYSSNPLCVWKGFDDNFYYGYKTDETPSVYDNSKMNQIIIQNNSATEQVFIDSILFENEFGGGRKPIMKFPQLNKIMFGGAGVYEIDYSKKEATSYDASYFNLNGNENLFVWNDNTYYIAGENESNQPVLLKVNAEDHSYTNLIPVNEYDIFKMDISNQGIITFNALRMSDGKKVIAKVTSSGDIEILDESLNQEVVNLINVSN